MPLPGVQIVPDRAPKLAAGDLGRDRSRHAQLSAGEVTAPQQRTINFTFGGALAGARKSLPMAVGVLPFGLVFGMTARQAGLSSGEAALMSMSVFAGTAQFVALGLWRVPLPALTIAFTTLLVNLRLVLMGATLRPYFGRLGGWRAYCSMLFLTDGGWAMQLQEFDEGGHDGAFLVGNGIAQYVAWVSSTIMGFTLGAVVGQPEKWGLTFIVPAAFLALLVGMWRGKADIAPCLVAAVAALLTNRVLTGNWFILVGGLSGSLVGALPGRHRCEGDEH
jgi:4-azaleucine resistance transporter AzlC